MTKIYFQIPSTARSPIRNGERWGADIEWILAGRQKDSKIDRQIDGKISNIVMENDRGADIEWILAGRQIDRQIERKQDRQKDRQKDRWQDIKYCNGE